MKKNDFIRNFAVKAELTQNDAREVVTAMWDTILEAINAGEEVKPFPGVTFSVRDRKARTGVNPQTGEKISIAACKVPHVKFGKAAKDAVA